MIYGLRSLSSRHLSAYTKLEKDIKKLGQGENHYLNLTRMQFRPNLRESFKYTMSVWHDKTSISSGNGAQNIKDEKRLR